MGEVLSSRWAASVLSASVAFGTVMMARGLGLLEPLELMAYDQLLNLRPAPAEERRPVVLIGIDEQDIDRWGWPIPDAVIADLLERLAADGARVIALDIYRDRPVPPGHLALRSVLAGRHNIIGVMKFGGADGVGVAPPPVLAGTDRVGFSDFVVDADGIVRRGLLFLDDGDSVAYALALRLALSYLQAAGVQPRPDPNEPRWLRLGETTLVPLTPNAGGYVDLDARGYQFLLDFPGGDRPFQRYSLAQVLDGEVAAAVVRDRIVIVGTTAASVKDYFVAPISRGDGDDDKVYGIAMHGYAASQLIAMALSGRPALRWPTETQEALWIVLAVLLGALLAQRLRSPLGLVLNVGGGAVMATTVSAIALWQGLWLGTVAAALGWAISGSLVVAYLGLVETRERALLMGLFSRYVHRDVAESVWDQRHALVAGGRPIPQRLTATVLFMDIKGFTSVSEDMDPSELMHWLDDCLSAMADLVMAHHGMVDKFIGDAMMALFGAPVPRTDQSQIQQDAVNAVHCAIAMAKKLETLNHQWRGEGKPEVGMRVGIHTGVMSAGSIGSRERLQFTVIGDTVNTASRLESFDRTVVDPSCPDYPFRILIGDSTRRFVADTFETLEVGEVSLKGKSKRLRVHLLTGWQRPPAEAVAAESTL